MAEGATITAGNGAKFKITYKGGAGKDVVLTEISQPPQPKFNSIVELAGGSIQLTGMGTNGLLYTLLANTNLATTNWSGEGGFVCFCKNRAAIFNSKWTSHRWATIRQAVHCPSNLKSSFF